jgi:hypothetical protein
MPNAPTKLMTIADRRSQTIAHGLEWVAWLMDRAVRVPGTRFRIGLDAILGLLPVGGDVLTGLVQTGLVLVALAHYRVPKAVAARMAANVLLDILVGAIPLLGDLFDIAFKANTRNLQLLERYRESRGDVEIIPAPPSLSARRVAKPAATPLRYLLPIALVLIVALGLMLIGFITLVRWLIR